MIWCFYKATIFLDPLINTLDLPNPHLYSGLKIALWAFYGFWAGLFGTGLWVIGHECGHQAFSESKTINNTVGWIIHSAYVHFFYLELTSDCTHVIDLSNVGLEFLIMHGVLRTQSITLPRDI